MNLDRFDQLTRYIELLLRATDMGFKLSHEINTAFKQLESEMNLNGMPFDKYGMAKLTGATITGSITTTGKGVTLNYPNTDETK